MGTDTQIIKIGHDIGIRRFVIAIGLLFSIAAVGLYFWRGYSELMAGLWLFGIIVAAIGFRFEDKSQKRKTTKDASPLQNFDYKRDLLIILGLILLCAPLYLAYVHSLPVQMNTDEIVIMGFQKTYAEAIHADLFGLSTYAGLPSLIFIVTGKLGVLFGGINLYHMRLIHGLFGLLVVVAGYVFFRQRLSRRWSFAATVILGTNHALFMISRMAMRENTALLIELVALLCLYIGFKHHQSAWTFVGGAVAGLSFYTYFPSRITMIIWLVFIGAWFVFFTPKKDLPRQFYLGVISLLGFLVVVAPYAIASSKDFQTANYHPRQQILLYPEGRKLQQTWAMTDTPRAAYKHNIISGLSAFNSKIHDNGYIYPNFGHGFVDPLSGVLVWVGLLVVLWRLARRRSRQSFDLLVIIGFMTIWLMLAFVINKAPNYTRLLVILPFSAYLITMGLQLAARLLSGLLRRVNPKFGKTVYIAVAAFGLVGIVGWNLYIANDFIKEGVIKGNALGTTARYMEARSNQPSYHFYLAADTNYAYYDWGDPGAQWQEWLDFFVSPGQSAQIISPDSVGSFSPAGQPLTIFMNNSLWQQHETEFLLRYPTLKKHLITTNGHLLAIEIP